MKFKEFKVAITELAENSSKNLRKGQAIFNCIHSLFNVGNKIKDNYDVDCYYDDSQIDKFIEYAYIVITIQDMDKLDKTIEILKTFREGNKIVEVYDIELDKWFTLSTERAILNTINFNSIDNIRIKDKLVYRPYNNSKELLKDCLKHNNLIKDKFCEDFYFTILRFNNDGFSCVINGNMESYDMLLKQYTWADDETPCGILE